MTEQEMLEKYEGVSQFQLTLKPEKVEPLLTKLIPLLSIPFDFHEYHAKRHDSMTTQTSQVYYTKHVEDLRCLILTELEEPYFQHQSIHLFIRFHNEHYHTLKDIIKEMVGIDLQNSLIKNSMMNGIVRRYNLEIDIVDEFDLWNSLFKQKQFWTDYFFLALASDERIVPKSGMIYPELVDPIRFYITEDAGLMIRLDEKIFESTLYLFHSSFSEPIQLGGG